MANTTLSFTGAVQTFTAPSAGTYDITAFGAQGGIGDGTTGGSGGKGAEIGGDFNLAAGEVLSIVVGGRGTAGYHYIGPGTYTSGGSGGGGGGGSFVIETFSGTSSVRDVLLVAGGGGGGGYATGTNGGGGQSGTAGHTGYGTTGGLGGTADSAGAGGTGTAGASGGGGGGGGYKGGNGGSDYGSLTLPGSGFSHTAAGGSYAGGRPYRNHNIGSYPGGPAGGFGGGGGGGYNGGGGGGGYSGGGGGGGGNTATDMGGGGGGGSIDNTSFANADKVQVANQNSGSGSVTIDPVCYLRGTRILTIGGEVPVEDLKQGDLVATRFGPFRPVKWIGKQSFRGVFIAACRAPVRIHAGALGENIPNRDLLVSPAHSVLLNEHLVDAGLLVNGISITQHPTSEQIDYFHVDLGVPDCIVANGAWAESYAEQDNRDSFHNVAEFGELFPDHQARYQFTCLPLVNDDQHEDLPLCRAVTLARVAAEHFTDNADVHVIADGVRIEPASIGEGHWTFRVPADAGAVRVASHASSPAIMATNTDQRMLGVCVESLIARAGRASITLPLDSPALDGGWNRLESDGDHLWRWTDGDAELPFAALSALVLGPDSNEVELIITGNCLPRYLLTTLAAEPAASTISRRMSV